MALDPVGGRPAEELPAVRAQEVVALVAQHQQFGLQTTLAGRAHELLGFAERHIGVVLTVDREERHAQCVDTGHRGQRAQQLTVVFRVPVLVGGRFRDPRLRAGVEGREVGHAAGRHAGPEEVRVPDEEAITR